MRRAQSAWLRSLGLPKKIIKWVGFAADETHRAERSLAKTDVAWERLEFPAIRAGLTRDEQRAQVLRMVGSAPKFSMCIYCPKKDRGRWLETSEADLKTVYRVDAAIRNLDEIGLTEGEAFLCSQLIPVADLIRRGSSAPDSTEGDSSCDGGACFL